MTVGIFFGSFNPIHLGHVSIAERFLQENDIDEVWLSVSPHNPLKEKGSLLTTERRVDMAQLAVNDKKNIKVVDFEKDLSQPSFTYEALLELQRQYPTYRFVLLIGGDNCGSFDKWRNHDFILDEFTVWAYPRDADEIASELSQKMRIIQAPLLDFASTGIRAEIQEGLVPHGLDKRVLDYIVENNLYKE